MQTETRLPDEEVKIKLSLCQKCNGIVRAAVEHQMNIKSKNEFLKEVMKYDLSVKTISLLEYREGKNDWCNCPS
jgi:hypothetical protein